MPAGRRASPHQIASTVILALAAAPRFWNAWLDHGVFWPDEIYQSLEQGHRLAFGFGFIPWEFQDGARSWLFPGLLGVLLKAASLLGANDSLLLISIAKTAMAALSVASLAISMRIAARIAGPRAALATGAIGAVLPLSVQFASRCLSESACAPGIALAAWLLMPPGEGPEVAPVDRLPRRALIAGALIGLSFVLRYQTAIVGVALAAALALSDRSRDLRAFVAGGAAVFLAGGALDWVTWGAPFHSLWTYAVFMTSAAHRFADPAGFYPRYFFVSNGIACLPLLAGAAIASRRAPALFGAVVAFVLFHEAFPYKELRYLVPVLPLFVALAGAGLAMALERAGRVALGAVVVTVAVPLGWHAASNTFGEYGWYLGTEFEHRSPWHFEEDVNLLLHDAGRNADLCGLLDFAGRDVIYDGGYSYLHRDVPLLSLQSHPEAARTPLFVETANYLIVPAGFAAVPGYRLVGSIGSAALARRDGGCVSHPELDVRRLAHP